MARIAIIDDMINPSYLRHPERVKASMVIDRQGIRQANAEAQPQRLTHASTCALILEKMTDDYELVGIAVSQEMEEADRLQKAFRACAEFGAEIAEVSFGGCLFAGDPALESAAARLSKSGCVIAAALSGRDGRAGCANILGVRCDRYGIMKPGEYICDRFGPSSARVTANCGFRIRENECGRSDSFSAAAVAARINRYRNEGIKAFNDILYCLEKDESSKYRAVLKLME